MSDTIKVSIEAKPAMEVSRKVYVEAKTKQLRAFGYSTLTAEAVDEQITAILEKKPLTVVGMFMEDEIVLP